MIDPRIFWWRRGEAVGNFGDALTLLLLDRLFEGEPLVDASSIHLIGSVVTPNRIRRAIEERPGDERPILFWGCGKKDPAPLPADLARRCRFAAVRGPLTRDALGLAAATPLGEPALLLPRCYEPRRDPTTRGRLLWVPHVHSDDPDERLLVAGAQVRRPDVANSVAGCAALIDAIASARFVMANALHAAAVAFAYGVPFAFWRSSRIDNPFKWADFAALAGFDMRWSDSLAEGERAFADAAPDRRRVDVAGLLEAAPYRLRASSPS